MRDQAQPHFEARSSSCSPRLLILATRALACGEKDIFQDKPILPAMIYLARSELALTGSVKYSCRIHNKVIRHVCKTGKNRHDVVDHFWKGLSSESILFSAPTPPPPSFHVGARVARWFILCTVLIIHSKDSNAAGHGESLGLQRNGTRNAPRLMQLL